MSKEIKRMAQDVVLYDDRKYVSIDEVLDVFNKSTETIDLRNAFLFVHKYDHMLHVAGNTLYTEIGTPLIIVGERTNNGYYALFGCSIDDDGCYHIDRCSDFMKMESENLKFELRQGGYLQHTEHSTKELQLKLFDIIDSIRTNRAFPVVDDEWM